MPLSLAGATLASGYIGAGATVANNLLGNMFSSMANNTNYKNAVKLWNMQNEYNSPINQVRRLKEAGLNPALMYNNAASGGTASSVAAPQVQYNSPLNGVLDKLGSLLQLKQMAANVEKTKQETKNAEISGYGQELQNKLAQQAYDFNTNYNPLRIGSLSADNDIKAIEKQSKALAYDFDKSANPVRLALLNNNLDTAVSVLDKLSIEKRNMLIQGCLLNARIRNVNADTVSKEASSAYTRVLIRQLEEVGIPMGKSQLAVQQLEEGFQKLIHTDIEGYTNLRTSPRYQNYLRETDLVEGKSKSALALGKLDENFSDLLMSETWSTDKLLQIYRSMRVFKGK